MSTLIPNYTISDFKKLKVPELKRLKSAEITADGGYLFTFVNPDNDYIRTQTEGLAMLSNTQGGEEIENIMAEAKV